MATAWFAATTAFAVPDGYSYFATDTQTGTNHYISKPRPQKFNDGRSDPLFEFSTWSADLGFQNRVVNCAKTEGVLYWVNLMPNGDAYPSSPAKFSPGSIGYAAWKYVCGNR